MAHPSEDTLAEKERSPWKLLSGTGSYHTSSYASLFSTSLSVLPHMKLNFRESIQIVRPSDGRFTNLSKVSLEDEVKESLEYVEPSTTRSFLPDDEDELLAGLMDDFDLGVLPTQLEDLDDDFFGSGGGLEIEMENHGNLVNGISRLSTSDSRSGSNVSHYGFMNGVGTISGEHPYGEHPSRTLFVRNINSNIEDSELSSLFEQYGAIRTLYTSCKHRGFVMISYYDIRSARNAMRALQGKPLRRRKLDIHFSIPKDNPSEKDLNQGTLVVFNLDPSVSNDYLLQIFGEYGEVKEIRETPHKQHHKFIEYYDVRAAEAALKALNKSDIAGKRIKLEPSRPGGAHRSLLQQHPSQEQEQDDVRAFLHQVGSPVADSPPGIWHNFGSPAENNSLRGYNHAPKLGSISPAGNSRSPGLAAILPSHVSNPVKIAPIEKDYTRTSHVNAAITQSNATQGVAFHNHFPAPNPKLSSSPGPFSSFYYPKPNLSPVSDPNLSSNPGPFFSMPNHSHVPDPKLSSSPGPFSPFNYSNPSSIETLSGSQRLWGTSANDLEHLNSLVWSSSLKGHAFPSSRQGIGFPFASQPGNFIHPQHHHVRSAPSGIPLEKHFGFHPDSPETSYMNQARFGVAKFGCNNGAMNMRVAFAGNFSDSGSPSSKMMSIPRNGPMYCGNGSFKASNNDLIMDHKRNRRAESGSQLDGKKQYQLDLENVLNGKDSRTTLMIKNIPNKYTSNMLLAAIDQTHKGSYDFLYLPIDFKNKCNVGYAFINMVSPSHIVSFYEAFNGKKWDKFNSEKVALLAYARIQGKTALVSHFQNSSLMNEDKRCRPILFQSERRGTGDHLEHFPSSNLNIFIREPDGSYTADSLDGPQGDPDTTRS